MTGSYFTVRGLAMMVGGYPSENFMRQVGQSHKIISLHWTFWVYMSAMTVVFGSFLIYHIKSELSEEELYKYKALFFQKNSKNLSQPPEGETKNDLDDPETVPIVELVKDKTI